ncbi:MAG: ATP synthase F1 subunit delta [Bryobacterales bacterium]|nr:ATP synthase F1 subunit delta [Bryobacterales bacterium]
MSLAVSNRYANALVDVVIGSKGAVEPQQVVGQLQALESAIQSSTDLRTVILSPAVTLGQKNRVMGRICDQLGMHRLVRNFVFLVIRNRRAHLLPQMRAAFEQGLDARMGVVKADISSAAELKDAARASLEAQLARLTGKRVRAQYSVDPALLGGAVARIGSTIFDGSVRGQLDTLRRKLSAGA